MQDLKHLSLHTLSWEVTGGCSPSKQGNKPSKPKKRKTWNQQRGHQTGKNQRESQDDVKGDLKMTLVFQV